jgi:hypothetical protein
VGVAGVKVAFLKCVRNMCETELVFCRTSLRKKMQILKKNLKDEKIEPTNRHSSSTSIEAEIVSQLLENIKRIIPTFYNSVPNR